MTSRIQGGIRAETYASSSEVFMRRVQCDGQEVQELAMKKGAQQNIATESIRLPSVALGRFGNVNLGTKVLVDGFV